MGPYPCIMHIQQLDLLFKNVVCTVCSYEYVFVGILTLKFEIRVNVRCFFPCYLHRIRLLTDSIEEKSLRC